MATIFYPALTQQDVGKEPFRGGDAGGRWFVMLFDMGHWAWMPWTYFHTKREAKSWARGKFASMDFVRIVRMED